VDSVRSGPHPPRTQRLIGDRPELAGNPGFTVSNYRRGYYGFGEIELVGVDLYIVENRLELVVLLVEPGGGVGAELFEMITGPFLTFIKLVRTSVDFGKGFSEVVGCAFGGGEGLAAGLDGDGAVAAGGAGKFLDAPAGLGLDSMADGQGGKHDRQVRLDRIAGAVVDRAGL
jgi:hypothetical protein